VAHANRKHGVAVLVCPGDDATGNGAAGTDPVLDDELLTQRLGESISNDAGGDVSAAAGAWP